MQDYTSGQELQADSKKVPVCLWGAGRVGRALAARILGEPSGDTLLKMPVLELRGLADRRDAVLVQDLQQTAATLAAKAAGGRLRDRATGVFPAAEWDRWLEKAAARVLVDASVSDFGTGQPARDLYDAALDRGMHIVTANKAPLVVALAPLLERARRAGVELRYGATVGASLPAWDLLRIVTAEAEVTQVHAILNGTSNWILTRMEEGHSFPSALAQARAEGYAEPDPRRDVEGHDTAAKLLILANSFWQGGVAIQQVNTTGITHLSPEEVCRARQGGGSLKLLGRIRCRRQEPPRLCVQAEVLPATHPLAGLRGTQKGVFVETADGPTYVVIGGASGPRPTAATMHRELLEILAAG